MKPTSETWNQLDWVDMLNATSSQASEDGASPCASQDGQTTVLFGPDPVRASLSARQAEEQGLLMSGTSGRTGITSSASASLQSYLANKLQAKTVSAGSTLYKLTWKQRDTPSQLKISALRASAHRTSDSASGSSGWPTPTVGNAAGSQMAKDASTTGRRENGSKATVSLNAVSQAAGWPTPQMRDFRSGGEDRVGNPDRSNNLNDFVLMSGWPTPAQTDHKGGYEGGRIRGGELSTDRLDVTAQISGWQTPLVQDAKGSWRSPQFIGTGGLNAMEALAKGPDHRTGPARLTATGEMLTGSSAEMENGGQLNPRFSGWLMGYPTIWCEAALSSQQPTRSRKTKSGG
jgi:hypothetical protein